MFVKLSRLVGGVTLVQFHCLTLLGVWVSLPMFGKRQKLPTNRGRASEDPTPNYNVMRFVNEGTADRFGTICKNRSFIKEKDFYHPDDFFRKRLRLRDGELFANRLIHLR